MLKHFHIHKAAQHFGAQKLLCGEPKEVEAFFKSLSQEVEPVLVFKWLRISMMYANDGGVGLRQLASGWKGSACPNKSYIAENLEDFHWN